MADFILSVHVLFIAVVVLAVPLIIAGGALRWQWVRNKKFRLAHLCMIAFVACESFIGMDCPLTVWENQLRGGSLYGDEGFIAHFLHSLVFYDFPHWVFRVIYSAYALLVAGLFYFVPVNRRTNTTKTKTSKGINA